MFSLVYMIVRQILAVLVLLVRRDVSGEAELLALRYENAVLRRYVSRVRYEPADRLSFGRRWAQVFPVTPATVAPLAPAPGGPPLGLQPAAGPRSAADRG